MDEEDQIFIYLFIIKQYHRVFFLLHMVESTVTGTSFFLIFRERGREGEREGNIDVREKHQSPLVRTLTGD